MTNVKVTDRDDVNELDGVRARFVVPGIDEALPGTLQLQGGRLSAVLDGFDEPAGAFRALLELESPLDLIVQLPFSCATLHGCISKGNTVMDRLLFTPQMIVLGKFVMDSSAPQIKSVKFTSPLLKEWLPSDGLDRQQPVPGEFTVRAVKTLLAEARVSDYFQLRLTNEPCFAKDRDGYNTIFVTPTAELEFDPPVSWSEAFECVNHFSRLLSVALRMPYRIRDVTFNGVEDAREFSVVVSSNKAAVGRTAALPVTSVFGFAQSRDRLGKLLTTWFEARDLLAFPYNLFAAAAFGGPSAYIDSAFLTVVQGLELLSNSDLYVSKEEFRKEVIPLFEECLRHVENSELRDSIASQIKFSNSLRLGDRLENLCRPVDEHLRKLTGFGIESIVRVKQLRNSMTHPNKNYPGGGGKHTYKDLDELYQVAEGLLRLSLLQVGGVSDPESV